MHQPPEALAEMDDFVREDAHEVRRCCPRSKRRRSRLDDAGKQAVDYIAQHVPEAGTAPMCGNSIGVDRRFLDQ